LWHISALKGVRVVPRVFPGSLKVCRSWGTYFYSELNLPKQTNILHIDASSLLIGSMPVQSTLMGSRQHHLTKWACFSLTDRLSLSCMANQQGSCWQAGWLLGFKSCAVLSCLFCCEHPPCEAAAAAPNLHL